MIEEIKKDLKILFMTYVITPCPDYMKKDTRTEIEIRGDIVTTIKLVNEILDKYKDKEDKYKNAWEEMREYNRDTCYIALQLEQKYGIEVE